MCEQGADRDLVEVNHAILAGRGLGLAERDTEVSGFAVGARCRGLLVLLPPGLLYNLLPHRDDPAGEVDIIPAQAHGLAAAHAGTGDHLEHGAEPVPADAVEEDAQLGRLPRLGLGALSLGQLDVLRGVVGHKSLPDRGRQG
ncbi:hypothetical protein OHB56_20330 [Streptomyces sp. NBC_01635]|nr:hypothetical protein OHB56_20330 [Streptomyces sp. NBC_01635]